MTAKAQHGSTAAIQARLTFVRLGQELQFLEEARIGRSFQVYPSGAPSRSLLGSAISRLQCCSHSIAVWRRME